MPNASPNSAHERGPLPPQPRSLAWLIWLIIAAVAAGAAYYWFYVRQPAPPPAPPAPAPTTLAAPAPPPAQHYPIEQASAPAEPAPAALPSLDKSDYAARDVFALLIGLPKFTQYFYGDDIIRRIVATVDNLPRERASRLMLPVKPVPGAFAVEGTGNALSIAPANAARYTPYVELFERIDSQKLVAAYVRLYPLFQQAYRELGYPQGYFNDRLVQAIDNVLATPDAPPPVAVQQPKVLYQYADPKLESLSAGQKTLLRMGPQNAAKVKAKLRQLRALVTGQGLK